MSKIDLATIVINYKMEELTCSFVKEELSKCKLDNLIVIVDNGATEENSQKMSESLNAPIVHDINAEVDEDCRCFIIFNKENTGFARGNNLGVKFVLRHFECQYLLFSNNDIRLKDSDVVEQLIAKLETLPDVGIIGPKVVGLDGHCQSPYYYESIYEWIFNKYMSKFLFRNPSANKHDMSNEGYCYWVIGCFILCRTSDFYISNMFDENTFLYGEEEILAERMLKKGRRSFYYSVPIVIHEHGKTIKANNNYMLIDYDFASKIYYYKKYIGVSRISVGIAILIHSTVSFIKKMKSFLVCKV